ncbi:reverse transcriptase [Cucumis melo var. makuwa]|nr:reverse transcriptase [Cucumis melo var. makuwa]
MAEYELPLEKEDSFERACSVPVSQFVREELFDFSLLGDSFLVPVLIKRPAMAPTRNLIHSSLGDERSSTQRKKATERKIRIADGSLAPIAGKGKISPCAGLSLHNDLSSGKMIGTARHSRGLYLLDDDTSSSSISRTSL